MSRAVSVVAHAIRKRSQFRTSRSIYTRSRITGKVVHASEVPTNMSHRRDAAPTLGLLLSVLLSPDLLPCRLYHDPCRMRTNTPVA